MSARTYNIVLLGLLACFLGVVIHLVVTQEPVSGDLTRVGGLAEHDFGWRGQKARFDPELVRYRKPGQPVASAQVLVIGDSFSHQSGHGFGWQNHFIARTGLDLLVYHLRGQPADKLLSDPAIRRHPPKLVIYQSAELSLPDHLPRYAGDCTLPQERRWAPLPVHPVPYRSKVYERRTTWGGEMKPRIDQAMHVIKLNGFWNTSPARIRLLPLTRGDLFSSRDQTLLVYGYDVPADDWRSLEIEKMACGLRNLKTFVERELGAPFVVLYAPGKLSAYSGYAAGARPSFAGFIPALIERSGIAAPPVRERLMQAIASGSRDVYLPNDSHWGDTGHRIAADALYDFLRSTGLIQADAAAP
jgi:hypothetical protein